MVPDIVAICGFELVKIISPDLFEFGGVISKGESLTNFSEILNSESKVFPCPTFTVKFDNGAGLNSLFPC